MTKKDYRVIVGIIQQYGKLHPSGLHDLITVTSDTLSQAYPNFNRDKFFAALVTAMNEANTGLLCDLLATVATYRGNEPLDGDAVDKLVDSFRDQLNQQEGNY